MECQNFRDEQLWTLEANDLFEANMSGIQALFKAFSTKVKGKMVLTPERVLKMVE